MGFRSYIKNTVKANTNAKSWVAWDVIRSNAKIVKGFADDLNPTDSAQPHKETFEEAVKRFGLTEAQIDARMKTHFRVFIICAMLGLFALAWVVLLLTKSLYLSSLVALALSGLMFAYAFSEYLFYFRMKQRRLDCTMREVFLSFLKR